MSITKLHQIGHWAVPPDHTNRAHRPLAGRVIFGMLTGDEAPESATQTREAVITSARDRRRR